MKQKIEQQIARSLIFTNFIIYTLRMCNIPYILLLHLLIILSYIFSLKSDPNFSKKLFSSLQWKQFNNNLKCLVFHLKSSFCSEDNFFSWLFYHAYKTAWRKKPVWFQNFKIYDLTKWVTITRQVLPKLKNYIQP